jgi:glycosyltransferase involved in cell wall biosynthesis
MQRLSPGPSAAEATAPGGGQAAGVNVCGYLRTESGIGSAIRGYLRALRALDIPVALKDLSRLCGNRAEDRTVTGFAADHPSDVNLVCGGIEQHYAIMDQLGEDLRRGRYNIGIWYWELPRFPEKWYDRFVSYDEIWVASSFTASALAPVSPIPVVRMPPVLTAEAAGSRDRGRRRLGVSPAEFVYLFVFDFFSPFERKNPLALVAAFKKAFTPSDPVRLVIKCMNPDVENFAALTALARGHPISIHAGYWTAEEMRDLTAACDAYVSLHRCEGVGLTITDAMALGKPVIATGWSGNMDFMNVANSFPVRYRLVELEANVGLYRAGEVWAEPSVEHAAELLRHVFANRQEAQARGQAARRDIEANYSEEPVGHLIRQRLAVVRSRERFAALKRALGAGRADMDSALAGFEDIGPFVPRYKQLTARIRELVRTALPPDATVLVVSRGDDELLKLDGRRAWHFPQNEEGVYAGHNPADSDAAIAQLEELRARGGQYLLFPGTALWWLEHYDDFREHLEGRYSLVVRREETCLIFALSPDLLPIAPRQGRSGVRQE